MQKVKQIYEKQAYVMSKNNWMDFALILIPVYINSTYGSHGYLNDKLLWFNTFPLSYI
jgi:hypothetical protein